MSKPLHDLLKKQTSEADFDKKIGHDYTVKAIEDGKITQLIDALTAHMKKEGNFILTTEASCVGIGLVLSKIQNGSVKVTEYFFQYTEMCKKTIARRSR